MNSIQSAPLVALVSFVFPFLGAVLEASAADLLIDANTTVLFSTLDGSADDEDGAVDGILTLSSLTVTGGGRIVLDVAIAAFSVAGDVMLAGHGAIQPDPDSLPATGPTLTIESGGSITLAGTSDIIADGINAGGAILICASGNIELRGNAATTASSGIGPGGVGGSVVLQAGERIRLNSASVKIMANGSVGGSVTLISCGQDVANEDDEDEEDVQSAILIKGRVETIGTDSGGAVSVVARKGSIRFQGPPNRIDARGETEDGTVELTAAMNVVPDPAPTVPVATVTTNSPSDELCECGTAPSAFLTLTSDSPLDPVGIGSKIGLTVTLNEPAPPEGTEITLSSDDTSVATVEPTSFIIGAGQTQGFGMTTAVGEGATILRASAPDLGEDSLPMGVTTFLISIDIDFPCISPGQAASLAVSLSSAAPLGGVTINLASTDEGIATVTPSVFVPAGSQLPEANPQVTGVSFGVTEIVATAQGFAPAVREVIVGNAFGFEPSPFTIAAGATREIRLLLTKPAPPSGLLVNLSTDDPGIATAPATVEIAPFKTSKAIMVTGVAPGNTFLRANAPDFIEGAVIIRVILPQITLADLTLGKDLQHCLQGSIQPPAPAGNLTIRIASADSDRVLVSTDPTLEGSNEVILTVFAGETDLPQIFVQALAGSGTVELTATDITGGTPTYLPDTRTMTLVPSGFVFSFPFDFETFINFGKFLRIEPTALDPNTLEPFITLGNCSFAPPLLRGGLAVDVDISSSNETVGEFDFPPLPLMFGGGDQSQNTNFVGRQVGSTELCVEPPVGFATPSSQRCLLATVSAALSVPDVQVGRNLQKAIEVRLQGFPLNAIDVTITVDDGNVATISADRQLEGGSSLTFPAQFQNTFGPIFVQGRSLGTTTVRAEAPGFGSAEATVTVVPAGFIVLTEFDVIVADTCGDVFVPVVPRRLNPVSLAPVDPRFEDTSVRGGLSVDVALTVGDPSIGTLSPQTVAFEPGDPSAIASFTPLQLGATGLVVGDPIPAGFDAPSSGREITISVLTPCGIPGSSDIVGLNLQVAAVAELPISSSLPPDVTFTSPDPNLLTISSDPAVAGGASVTVPSSDILDDDFVTRRFAGVIYAQGRGLGLASVSVQAPGLADGVFNFTVVPSGFIHCREGIETTVFSPNEEVILASVPLDPFTLNPLPNSLRIECRELDIQPIRGGLDVNVPVESSDLAVGRIVDSPASYAPNQVISTVHFDPQIAGESLLTVLPGEPVDLSVDPFSTPSSHTEITAKVRAPKIFAETFLLNRGLGMDLQVPVVLTLEVLPPNPVDVVVTSQSPACVSVSRDATLEGTDSVIFEDVTTIEVGTVYVQGLALEDTSVVVQAAGFKDTIIPVALKPSGFVFSNPRTPAFASALDASNRSLTVAPAPLDPITLNPIRSNPLLPPSSFITQPVRGGLSVVVDVTSSNPGVGPITTSPLAFGPGASFANTEFNPQGIGQTILSVEAPNGFPPPSRFRQIAVSVNTQMIVVEEVLVGKNLQESLNVFLDTTPPGLIDVTLTSNDPSVALVSLSGNTEGSSSVTFTNVDSTTVGTVYVQAIGMGGTSLTIEASGFANGTALVDVLPAGFLFFASATLETAVDAPNTTLFVGAAAFDPVTMQFVGNQPIRGGLTAVVDITNQNPSVGDITTPVTFVGGPFEFSKQVEFNPQAEGMTTLELLQPAGFDVPPFTTIIEVTVLTTTATVPDVVGHAQADAETAIVAAGLTVRTVTFENSDTVPAGQVISQIPVGGTIVAPGSPVDLVVSLGSGGSLVLSPSLLVASEIDSILQLRVFLQDGLSQTEVTLDPETTYSSSDPLVVSVDVTGMMSFVAEGEAQVSAMFQGLTATASISVDVDAMLQAEATIGSAGGVLNLPNGTGLSIPPSALSSTNLITIAEVPFPPGAIIPTDSAAVASTYEFEPSGLTFETDIELTIAYDPSLIPIGFEPESILVYEILPDGSMAIDAMPEESDSSECVNQGLDPDAATVIALTDHFSCRIPLVSELNLTEKILQAPDGTQLAVFQNLEALECIESNTEYIVLHSTNSADARTKFWQVVRGAIDPSTSFKAHYYVGLDGTIVQVSPDSTLNFHVRNRPPISNANSIGIEIFHNCAGPECVDCTAVDNYPGRQVSAIVRLCDFLLRCHPNITRPSEAHPSGSIITHFHQDLTGDSCAEDADCPDINGSRPGLGQFCDSDVAMCVRKCDPSNNFRSDRSDLMGSPSIEGIIYRALRTEAREGLINAKGGDALGIFSAGDGGMVTLETGDPTMQDDVFTTCNSITATCAECDDACPTLRVAAGDEVELGQDSLMHLIVEGTLKITSSRSRESPLNLEGVLYVGPTGVIDARGGFDGDDAFDLNILADGFALIEGRILINGTDKLGDTERPPFNVSPFPASGTGEDRGGFGGEFAFRSAAPGPLWVPTIITRGGDADLSDPLVPSPGGNGGAVQIVAMQDFPLTTLPSSTYVFLEGMANEVSETAQQGVMDGMPDRLPTPPPFNQMPVISASPQPSGTCPADPSQDLFYLRPKPNERLALGRIIDPSTRAIGVNIAQFSRGIITVGGIGGGHGDASAPLTGRGGDAGNITITNETSGRTRFVNGVQLVAGAGVERLAYVIFVVVGCGDFEYFAVPSGGTGAKGALNGGNGGGGGNGGDIDISGIIYPCTTKAPPTNYTIRTIFGHDGGNPNSSSGIPIGFWFDFSLEGLSTNSTKGSGGCPGGHASSFPGFFGPAGNHGVTTINDFQLFP